jgi:hypothetical protein
MDPAVVIVVIIITWVLFFMPMGPPTKRKYPCKYRCPICDWPMDDIRDRDFRAIEQTQYDRHNKTNSGHWCGFCGSDRIK